MVTLFYQSIWINRGNEKLSLYWANVKVNYYVLHPEFSQKFLKKLLCFTFLGIIHLVRSQNFPKNFISYALIRTRTNSQFLEKFCERITQSVFTCSGSTIKTLEQGVKYVQSQQ